MPEPMIYKYTLAPYHDWRPMPEGAEILACGAQGDEIVVWAAVDPHAPEVDHPVAVVPTGWRIEDGWRHFGTVQMDDGLVFHVLTARENRGADG